MNVTPAVDDKKIDSRYCSIVYMQWIP